MKRLLFPLVVICAVAFGAGAFVFGTQRVAAKLGQADGAPGGEQLQGDERAALPGKGSPEARGGPSGAPTLTVEVASATRVTWQDWQSTLGTVKSLNNIAVKAAATGRITQIKRSGQHVKRGDVLVQLDDSKERAQLDSKLAALDLARSSFARVHSLAEKGISSTSELQTAETNVRLAEADVAFQRAVLSDFAIRAHFDGQVGLHDLVVGQRIELGQSVFTFQSTDALFVEFRIPVDFAGEVQGADAVLLESDTPRLSQSLKVQISSPDVDTDTSTVRMRANLPEGVALRPGMTPRVRYKTRQIDDVVTVPDIAIVDSAYGSSLFVVDANGAVQQRFVIVQGSDRGRVAVASGLQRDETVVVTGQMRLYPGAIVATRPFQSPGETLASATGQNRGPGGE